MKKFRLVGNIGLLAFFVIAYVVNPTNLNPLFAQGAMTWLVVASAFIIINSTKALEGLHLSRDASGRVHVEVNSTAKDFKVLILILAVLWGVYFVVSAISIPLFNSKAYRDQLGTPQTTSFSEDMQLLDLSQVPIVDQNLARNLADKKLGENPGMGSQVYVGIPVIQQINGELMWAVPLHHSGFFKWFSNMDGSDGYILVSATNLQDIEFVKAPIKYQPNSYFFDDITRYLRVVQGYAFEGLTDYSFEIDDAGQPYWIITTYKNEWLFSLPEATGVITLNATTGETVQYTIDNVPEWVDRVQPEGVVMNQVNHQGQYVHGVFNFSNKDKFMTSDQTAIIYNEGSCYLFTGLTSVGADESAIGFIMVDMVTKESKIYQISGATEEAAMRSAQGSVQQYGYVATAPIIINHNGIPTYFITLKDDSGLIKQYAFVSVSDVTSVGVGDTINTALRAYNGVLGSSNSFVTEGGELVELTGTIIRIAPEDLDTGLTYKMIVDGKTDKIFTADAEISAELALTQVGDNVKLKFYESEAGILTLSAFDNLEFTQ